MGFYEFKPAGYDADSNAAYPLIIFLHGVGERGNGTTELPMVLNTSFPKLLADGATMKFTFHGKNYGFLVLMPQMSKEYINWQNFYVDAMIDYAKKNLKVDPDRIFICGWSLGGGGAWKYATASAANASRIAGVVLAAPAPDFTDLGNIARGKVAVWAHHAKDDASVPIRLTTNAINEVNAYSPEIRAMVTYYASGGHTTAREAPFDTLNNFQYPNMYEWMIRTSRRNTTANNKPPVPFAGNDTAIIIPLKMILNGAASYDPNDVIVRYRWRMLEGPISPQLNIQAPYSPVTVVSGFELGNYVFRLTVQDEFGFTRSSDIHVHTALPANGENAVPYVNAGKDFTTFSSQLSIKGVVKDFDGKVVNCRWRQIGGPAPISISHHSVYAFIKDMTVEGTYLIELIAYDDKRGVGRDTLMITKNAALPVYPLYWFNRNIGPGKQMFPYPGIFLLLISCTCVPLFISCYTSVKRRYPVMLENFVSCAGNR